MTKSFKVRNTNLRQFIISQGGIPVGDNKLDAPASIGGYTQRKRWVRAFIKANTDLGAIGSTCYHGGYCCIGFPDARVKNPEDFVNPHI